MTPQTNEEIAEHCLISELAESIGRGRDYITAKALITQALDLKDTRIHSLEAGVEELKKQILDMKLLPNQGHACDGFCLGTCLHGTRLAANLKIAVEALETVRGQSPCDYIAWEGRQGCKVHENSHQCLAHDTLSRLKSGGGGS